MAMQGTANRRSAADPTPHPSPCPTNIRGNSLHDQIVHSTPACCACKARIATILQAMRGQVEAGLPQPRQQKRYARSFISGGQGAHKPARTAG